MDRRCSCELHLSSSVPAATLDNLGRAGLSNKDDLVTHALDHIALPPTGPTMAPQA